MVPQSFGDPVQNQSLNGNPGFESESVVSPASQGEKYFWFDFASASVQLAFWKTTYEANKAIQINHLPFFVVVDLSAEESTDRVSRTCLLKVSQNASKRVLYCIRGVVWQQPQEISFQAHASLVYLGGLSCGSSGFSVSVLLRYLKLSPRELGGGNRQQEPLRT